LLSRLRDLEDSDSWRTFFEMYWQLLYNVARKSGLANDQAEDVVQETVIAVARKMPEFRYDPAKGSFKRWLLLICRRRIQDYFRRLYSSARPLQQASEELISATENVPASTLPPDAEIDGIWEQEWRENIFPGRTDPSAAARESKTIPGVRLLCSSEPTPGRSGPDAGPEYGPGLPGQTSPQRCRETRRQGARG
jgi:RNA polymerase sigma factor (sigma-70 family)